MAKGGGGGARGRPRKLMNAAVTAPPIFTPPRVEPAESSSADRDLELKAGGSNGPVDGVNELDFHDAETSQIVDLLAEDQKEEVAKEIEDGEAPPLRKRGMALGYVAPVVKQGKATAKLCATEIAKEAQKWKRAIILYVIGDAPTITYLRDYLQKQCEVGGAMEIFYNHEGYFVIKFENPRDKARLLGEGPYTIANRPMIMKDWMADFNFENEVLKEVPLWVRLPNLPLTCWSGDSLSRIGSVLGKPVCADECTSQQKRISYARLLVEVDITQPLIYRVPIEDDKGLMVEQQVIYEWVPMFCHKCHKLGHICKEKKESTVQKPQQQWVPKVSEKDKGKDKGKEKVIETARDEWNKPKKPATSSFQDGELKVTTDNFFQDLVTTTEGGDLIPSSIT